MSAPIRVILFGVGRVGRDVARIVSARPSERIVAAHSRNPGLAGQDLGVIAGVTPLEVEVTSDHSRALAVGADILVIATTSFLRDVAPDIMAGVDHGLNVLCTAEEMAFPWLADESLAKQLDQRAKEHQVTVLGGGVNPGFLSDALVLTAASAAWDVSHIGLKRGVNLSRFSATVLTRLGIGFSKEEFDAGTEAGTIFGHIGFPQSMHLVARALGARIERITKRFAPLFAERDYMLDHVQVKRGTTAGFQQYVTAHVDGQAWFDAEFLGHIDPESIGAALQDEIDIRGEAPVHLLLTPGLRAQPSVAALVANSLRRVVEAPPGLLTVADLPPARPSPTRSAQLTQTA
jgi:4-hydroxy-tetrahydrodipicolinate reductase